MNSYKEEYAKLLKQADGVHSAIDQMELHLLNERVRARAVLDIADRDGIRPETALMQYMIDRRVVAELVGEMPAVRQKKRKKADLLADFVEEVKARAGSTWKVAQLAEFGEVSEGTIRKLIANRPDLFTKSGHGLYTLRNSEADRLAEASKGEMK